MSQRGIFNETSTHRIYPCACRDCHARSGETGQAGPRGQATWGLSAAQKSEIKAIRQQGRTKTQPVADQLRQNREALRAAVKANDAAQIQTLSKTRGDLRGQALALRSQTRAKVYADLTPEQRQKLDARQARAARGSVRNERLDSAAVDPNCAAGLIHFAYIMDLLMDRRTFIVYSAVAAASASLAKAASPNDTIRIASVGLHGRGKSHIDAFTKMPNVELVALCDVDASVLATAVKSVETKTGKTPVGYTDLRKLLEDKSIDAISIATPNHQHTLQAIWAMQAGKDVYVEKPCSHDMFEAQQIVAATRKYNKIVQMGSQSRSDSALMEAVQKMREGAIGDLYMARGLCYKWRDTIG